MRFTRLCALAAAPLLLASALALPGAALAADMPPYGDHLRGAYVPPEPPAALYNWGGFYVGAFGGVSQLRSSHGTQNATLATIANNAYLGTPAAFTPYLPPLGPISVGRASETKGTFGGFVGYNIQWEDTVFGVEADYTRSSADLVAANSFTSGPTPLGTYIFNGRTDLRSRLALNDYATIRARAGWAIGSVLPYATLGLAVGRADVTNSATIAINGADTAVPPGPPVTYTATQGSTRSDRYAYGLAAGAGVDIAILPNLFGRIEYQYVDFDAFGGVVARAHTARAAAAAKF